jgi:DNA-binding response OmpR family regulator
MRILVVEDEPQIRHIVERVLTPRGHHVLSAPSVFDAMALLLDFPAPPDVALLDLGLPGMGGFAYAEQLQQAFPSIRLVFMTGLVDEAHLTQAEQKGALLMKPFAFASLIERIDSAI